SIYRHWRKGATGPTYRIQEFERASVLPRQTLAQSPQRTQRNTTILPSCPLWPLCEVFDRRLARDFAHRFFEQLLSRRNLMPGRCARWVWQRNQIECMFGTARTKLSTDYLLQLFALDELRDRQTTDRNDQARL